MATFELSQTDIDNLADALLKKLLPALESTAKRGANRAITTTSNNMLSPREVAEQLGISYPTVMRFLTAGTLKGNKVGRQWKINRNAVTMFRTGRSNNSDTVRPVTGGRRHE